jgi:hypothetical protein
MALPTSGTGGNHKIKDVRAGLRFLESKDLLPPSGSPYSLEDLVGALFHMASLPGTPLQTQNRIRSVTYLLKEQPLHQIADAFATKLQDLVEPTAKALKD